MENKIDKIVGANVKRAIRDAGMKCNYFRSRLGLSSDGMSRRLNGKKSFTAYELSRIAAILDVEIGVFYAGVGEEK